jgi:predicted Fe-S protein YdhL (DUF1289 family)
MQRDNWNKMSADEKAEHLATFMEEFIEHQNGANARMSSRLQALEERMAQIGKADKEAPNR